MLRVPTPPGTLCVLRWMEKAERFRIVPNAEHWGQVNLSGSSYDPFRTSARWAFVAAVFTTGSPLSLASMITP